MKMKTVAARISCSILTYFVHSIGYVKPVKNWWLMCQRPVCTLPMTSGHTWLPMPWTRPSGWFLT